MAGLKYLLDTNFCVLLLNEDPSADKHFREGLLEGFEFFLSTVSTYELAYGAFKSSYPHLTYARLMDFLAGQIIVIPFEHEDALSAGRIRSELTRRKVPIGPYDTLIAGQAVARELTLVTANVREFSRVEGLLWEDWSRP